MPPEIEVYDCEYAERCPFHQYPKSSILSLTELEFPECGGILPDEEVVKYFCEPHQRLFDYAERNGIQIYNVPVRVPILPERASSSRTVINEIINGLQVVIKNGLLLPEQYGTVVSAASKFGSTLSSLWSILKDFEVSLIEHKRYAPDNLEYSLRRFLCNKYKGRKIGEMHPYLLKTNGDPLSIVGEDDIKMLFSKCSRLTFALGGQDYFDRLGESLR